MASSMSCVSESPAAPAYATWARPGTVESVTEVDTRIEGHPAAGALAGALIGSVLFHGRFVGTAAGAAVGAAASSGSGVRRNFQVLVMFDDGDQQLFVYRDYAPFAPGSRVVLSAQGLSPG